MGSTDQENLAGRVISRDDFKESAYQDSSWEVVGEVVNNEDFVPLAVGVLPTDGPTTDPMFADYGGIPESPGGMRWHLPEHLSAKAFGLGEGKQAEVEQELRLKEDELEALKASAFEEGRQAALADLELDHQAKVKDLEQRMVGLFKDVSTQLNENLEKLELQAVELALSISKKIIDTTVEINPEYITQVVREAIGQIGSASVKLIRVSPQDLEFIEFAGIAKEISAYDGTWEFKADETVRSGCIVETAAGEIDYQLDQAWERIRDSVIKVARE